MSDLESLISTTPENNSDSKRQKLLECVSMGQSKFYLGKIYREEQINKLKEEEVNKLFALYEAKLSSQMIISLGKSIIQMYSIGACSVLGIKNQDDLCKDLESDPFLNSALQRFTCELYYRFGSFLAPLSVGLITSRHYVATDENIIVDKENVSGTKNSSNDERFEES